MNSIMQTKIIRIGNSQGIVIPSEILKSMKLSEKSYVNLDLSGDVLTMRASQDSASLSGVKFFVCPVCGNVLYGTGDVQLNCHGHNLEPLEPQAAEGRFEYSVETIEDEYFVSIEHEMTKQNYISFMAAVSADRIQLVKLFPEGPAEARFKKSMVRYIYFYTSKDGLFKIRPMLHK